MGYEPQDIMTIPVEQFLYDLNQQVYDINVKLKALLDILVSQQEEQVDTRTEKEKLIRTIGGNF